MHDCGEEKARAIAGLGEARIHFSVGIIIVESGHWPLFGGELVRSLVRSVEYISGVVLSVFRRRFH
jgi:hypothetical protein